MVQHHDLLLFDLDGTLSDPLEGIGRSINFALTHFGYEPLAIADLAPYVGPPLDQTFKELTNDQADVKALVAKYRERYSAVGYSENVLYPGVVEALLALSTAQIPMAICTSKPARFAEKILELFGLRPYFQFVSGGDIGISKAQQIEALLAQGRVSGSTVMIGDRGIDMLAAHTHRLKAGGVLWGYGSPGELAQHQPLYLFGSPLALTQFCP